ncbi:SDR family oxidoreductase [bacterium]|jgi:dehydrogenase/reductase SDR family member 4|nr:SDR family oxidoreductase [bacterium]
MIDRFSLEGKHALITGGTRGIGLAIVKGYLEAGATVSFCGRKQEGVDEALKELGSFGEHVRGFTAHIGKGEEINSLVKASQDAFGSIGILVNNAGTNPYYGPIVESEDWAWEKTFDVNLTGPYRLSREVAKGMMASGGGSIVNIASIAGLSAAPLQGIYSVTKAGLIMLTKVMAGELGKDKIRVNCICPGVIKTKLSEALWKDEEAERKFAKMKALKRIGETDELVGAAIYLGSEASSFTTGASLQVDGGMIL